MRNKKRSTTILETLDETSKRLRAARAREARLLADLSKAQTETREAEKGYQAARSAVAEAYPSTVGI